jgi:hypothetical protein
MAAGDDDGLDKQAWAAACGQVLAVLMANAQTTIYWLSQVTGLPYTTVLRYARGRRPPTLYATGLLCRQLGVTADQFLKRATAAYRAAAGGA